MAKNLLNSKKGLSTVVTTLIIILLVLVAIGIVWVVIRGIVESGTEQIDIHVRCIETDVKASAVDCSNPAQCDVTLTRKGQGYEMGGVKLVFSNANGETSGVLEEAGDIIALDTVTLTIDSGITNPNKVEVTVYFEDVQGEQRLCTQTNPYSF